MLTILKGLPISYFKDLQDDKEIAFRSNETICNCIAILNEVLKNFDEDRVYVSDIKKVISWYNTLQKSGFAVASDPSKTDDAIEENDVKKAVSKVKITPKSTSNSKAKSSAKKKSKKKDI